MKDNHEMTLACLLMYKLNKQETWFHGDFFLSYNIAYHNKNIRKINNIKIYNHWKCGSTFHKYSTKYNKEKDKNEPIRLYLTSPNHHVFLTVQFFLLCERTIKLYSIGCYTCTTIIQLMWRRGIVMLSVERKGVLK